MSTEAEFLKSVENHIITVRYDDGLNRDLLFRAPDTGNQWFGITTWPMHLCISGDMGCFVFSRTDDMFCFFRPSKGRAGLQINEDYWGEKLKAIDTYNGYKEYDEGAFREAVKNDVDQWEFASGNDKRKSWIDVKEQVLYYSEDEQEALRAVQDFTDDYGNDFQDFFEHRLYKPTYHYTWCIRAIAWAIQQYDKQPKGE